MTVKTQAGHVLHGNVGMIHEDQHTGTYSIRIDGALDKTVPPVLTERLQRTMNQRG